MTENIPLYGSHNSTYSQSTYSDTIGKRNYELTNHLGNVLSVISDKVIPHSTNGTTVDWFQADIRQSTDYSAFGVQLENRDFVLSGAKEYRMGFNGMEEDDQVKGDGNSYDFGARMLDPRLGRWLTRDKLAANKSDLSPYQAMKNNPLLYRDPDGNDEFLSIVVKQKGKPDVTIRSHKAISDKVMAGAIRETGCYQAPYSQKYYDYRTILTVTLDESGEISQMKKSTYRLKDRKRAEKTSCSLVGAYLSMYSEGAVFSPSAKGLNLEGSGGTQNGGLSIVTEDETVSPTKYKSKFPADEIDDDIIGLVGGMSAGKSMDLEAMSEFADGVDKLADMVEKIREVTDDSGETGYKPISNTKVWGTTSYGVYMGTNDWASPEEIITGDTLGGKFPPKESHPEKKENTGSKP